MNILVTLNSGLGADLGPNFNLTANVGSVTPSSVTKSQLTTGVFVDVDPSATQITVTSTGTCTNSILLSITGQTTSTTTLGISSFVLGYHVNNFFTACTNFTSSPTTYYSTTGAILQVGTKLYNESTLSTTVIGGYYSNGTDWFIVSGGGTILSTGSCATTTTTSTSTTSTSTSTTTAAPTSTTTSTSTTLGPEIFSLGYSATTDWEACFASQTNYYAYTGELLQNGLGLYTDSTLSTKAPSGWYSNGMNYWYIPPVCKEYTFTNNTGFDDYVDYFDCDGLFQQIYVYDGTTSTAVCVDAILELRGMTANDNGAGSCPPSTTGIFQDEAPCPTTTTTSTTSTSTTSTTTSTTSTSTTSTTTTTAAPETTTTSTSTSTTSTTTVALPPGETSTTTTSTTAAPTTTTTTTAAPTTTTTTAAPKYAYIVKDMISNDLCTYQSTGTDYWSYTSYTSGFYTINGGGVRKYLEVASHTNYTNEITSVGSAPCTPVTTSTTSTTSTTTSAPTTSEVTISVQGSLDIEITDVQVDGVSVVLNSPYTYPINVGTNPNVNGTVAKVGTFGVVVYYGCAISGQKIEITDSTNTIVCQNTGVGSGQTLGALGQVLDGTSSPSLTITALDGTC